MSDGAGIDLGHGHTLRFVGWHPDRALNPQYDGLPDVERAGALVAHPSHNDPTHPCEGFIQFAGPQDHRFGGGPTWKVVQWEPLTVTPSLLCHCGDHGWITEGRWQPC